MKMAFSACNCNRFGVQKERLFDAQFAPLYSSKLPIVIIRALAKPPSAFHIELRFGDDKRAAINDFLLREPIGKVNHGDNDALPAYALVVYFARAAIGVAEMFGRIVAAYPEVFGVLVKRQLVFPGNRSFSMGSRRCRCSARGTR